MKRFIPVLPWLGALLLIAVALLCFESDLLWRVQMYNLFLDTPLFFRELMVEPGGMLSYLGCYFTQFFYHPWLGVLMLCGWWLLLMWLTKRAFRIADNWTVLALIPVSCYLLVSEIPMFALKFKTWGWKGNEVKYFFLLTCIPLLVLFGISGIAMIIAWYVLLSVITSLRK